MMRLNIVKGLGPVLIVAEGWSVDLPAEVHKTLDERTDPGWPTTWFAPRLTGKGAFTDVYSVMANMGANHGAFTYGHIGADILTLASMLRIPVYAHNIPDDQIYRPLPGGSTARRTRKELISGPAPTTGHYTENTENER